MKQYDAKQNELAYVHNGTNNYGSWLAERIYELLLHSSHQPRQSKAKQQSTQNVCIQLKSSMNNVVMCTRTLHNSILLKSIEDSTQYSTCLTYRFAK